MKTSDIGVERARRATDNEQVKAPDALRLLAEEIEAGKVRAEQVVIVAYQDGGDSFSMSTRFVNIRMTDAVKVLELAKHSILRDNVFGG